MGRSSTTQKAAKRRNRLTCPDSDDDDATKKDKKLVFLSKSVLQKVRAKPMVTGTQIANEILEIYKQFCQSGQKVDFKNVQRRVYDALNVLSAMDIIHKDKYNIIYNHDNQYVPADDMLDSPEDTHQQQSQTCPDLPPITPEQALHDISVFDQNKERVLNKQLHLLDLIKQRVSIDKLKERNMLVQDYQQSKLKLPLLFLQIPHNSHVKISQDQHKQHLNLECDKVFQVSDENILLQKLVPRITDHDISRLYDPEITEYLKKSTLLKIAQTQQPINQHHQQQPHDSPGSCQQVASNFFAATEHHSSTNNCNTPLTKLLPRQQLRVASAHKRRHESDSSSPSHDHRHSPCSSHKPVQDCDTDMMLFTMNQHQRMTTRTQLRQRQNSINSALGHQPHQMQQKQEGAHHQDTTNTCASDQQQQPKHHEV